MKRILLTYTKLLIAVLLCCNGNSALWAQSTQPELPDSLQQPGQRLPKITQKRNRAIQTTAKANSPGTKQKGKIVAGNIPTDSIVNDAAHDSLQLAAVTDSLLQKVLSSRKSDNYQPDPIRSMWLALVFPGGGQIYNRRYWKLPIVYGGFLGCAYALTWNNQMLRDYQQAYLDIMDTDPTTKSYEQMLPLGYDITGKEERFKNIFKNKKNYYRKYRDMSIFAFAGVYLISVIDAYVDAELSTFDLSEDLSLNFSPAFIQTDLTTTKHYRNIPALSCRLDF